MAMARMLLEIGLVAGVIFGVFYMSKVMARENRPAVEETPATEEKPTEDEQPKDEQP